MSTQTATVSGTTAQQATGALGVTVYTRDIFAQILEQDLDQVFIGSSGQEFAEDESTIIYTHATGEVENYPAIYESPHSSQGVNSEAEFNGLKPSITLQDSKLVRAINKGDRVQVQGIKYYIENYITDGVGVTTIYLRRK